MILAVDDGASPPDERIDGYAPIESYAAIGDGRTVALVARDGCIDWLAAPTLASPGVFSAILDARRGGSFRLAPVEPFGVARRYADDTNVLETTFSTAGGAVRVTDALVLGEDDRHRRLVRRVEGLAGEVELQWLAEPRFDFTRAGVELGGTEDAVTAQGGGFALALQAWGAGHPEPGVDSIGGRFTVRIGETADLLVSAGADDPAPEPWTRDEADGALSRTVDAWRTWAAALVYDGPWRDAVIRSALALKLLVFEPTGAIAAAATTSLPEVVGGVRNWDYRYSWVRDASLALDSLLALGCVGEARRFFSWLESACHDAAPSLKVLYALDGAAETEENELPLAGYRGSRPVRTGNGAATQLQLGLYGELLQTAFLFASHGHELGPDTRRLLAETADLVATIWPERDRGIWEVRTEPLQFTHSKMMCTVALDRAIMLAERGELPGGRVDAWRDAAAAARAFVDGRCWSDELGSYARAAETPTELDASLLLGMILGYAPPDDGRLAATVEAVRGGLAEPPFVYRYRVDDGLPGREGAFLASSFWVATALGRMERLDEAAEVLDAAVGLGNDVGLFSEEIDPATGAFLGNFPQAFTHLGLVNAAVTISRRGTP